MLTRDEQLRKQLNIQRRGKILHVTCFFSKRVLYACTDVPCT